MRVLVDFHHSSLLRALILLFEERLGHEVYRPIGMEWYDNAAWCVWPSPETAKQYLGYDQQYEPEFGGPVNKLVNGGVYGLDGTFACWDPGLSDINWACTYEFFMDTDFDLIIASLPTHVEPFMRLAQAKGAKLIQHIGNVGWEPLAGIPSLSSVRHYGDCFHHQEFRLDVFKESPALPTGKACSYTNCLQEDSASWGMFLALEAQRQSLSDFTFHSYGGQCRDGGIVGYRAVAKSMTDAEFIVHLKSSGDGFGHVLYNSYAIGRPVVLRADRVVGTLGEELLSAGAHIDISSLSPQGAWQRMEELHVHHDMLLEAGAKAAERFRQCVDYAAEAEKVRAWLASL